MVLLTSILTRGGRLATLQSDAASSRGPNWRPYVEQGVKSNCRESQAARPSVSRFGIDAAARADRVIEMKRREVIALSGRCGSMAGTRRGHSSEGADHRRAGYWPK